MIHVQFNPLRSRLPGHETVVYNYYLSIELNDPESTEQTRNKIMRRLIDISFDDRVKRFLKVLRLGRSLFFECSISIDSEINGKAYNIEV